MGSARTNSKKGEKKGETRAKKRGIEAQRVKPLTPTPAVDALIGEEEQTGGKREETNQLLGTIRSPPTTRIDHTVYLFFCSPPSPPGGGGRIM